MLVGLTNVSTGGADVLSGCTFACGAHLMSLFHKQMDSKGSRIGRLPCRSCQELL
jgi:hypothetical protein